MQFITEDCIRVWITLRRHLPRTFLMCTSDFFDEMAARIELLGFDAEVALYCAAGIGDTPVYVDGNLEAGDASGRRVVLPKWILDAEESRWLSPLPEEVRWHRLAEWWEGMRVESAEGKCYTVFWEQKPRLVRIGILAVLPDDSSDSAALHVRLLAGELDDLDRDSSVGGCIRDAELLAIWKQRRQAWEGEGEPQAAPVIEEAAGIELHAGGALP